MTETTTFCLTANVASLSFAGRQVNVEEGDFGKMGCLSKCESQKSCITIPKGEKGQLRVWWSCGSACGGNQNVKLQAAPTFQPNLVSGVVNLRSTIEYYRKPEYDWVTRESFIARGLVELGQQCYLSRPVGEEAHDCTAFGDRLQCTTNPKFILPEGVMMYENGGYYLKSSVTVSQECIDILLVSSIQETVRYCPTKNGWTPVQVEINSTVEAPPHILPWPEDEPHNWFNSCSLFNPFACNAFMTVIYLAIWALLTWLFWKLIGRRMVERCKEKAQEKKEEKRREQERKEREEQRRIRREELEEQREEQRLMSQSMVNRPMSNLANSSLSFARSALQSAIPYATRPLASEGVPLIEGPMDSLLFV